jgi:uncharacterized RDD family membrane protein YckC
MARKEPPEEPLLFDLPLGKAEGPTRDLGVEEQRRRIPAGPSRERKAGPEHLRPLELPLDSVAETSDSGEREEWSATEEERAGRGSRFVAGLADVVAHAAVAVLGVIGARQMGVRPGLSAWPGFTLFLLAFSFLYVVVSLAFWGHTLGMVWAGLIARGRDGEPLSFDQSVRRWLGGIATTALLGLPLLVAWRGRALSDLLSASETLARGEG